MKKYSSLVVALAIVIVMVLVGCNSPKLNDNEQIPSGVEETAPSGNIQTESGVEDTNTQEQEEVVEEVIPAYLVNVENIAYSNGGIVDLIIGGDNGVLEEDENGIKLCYETIFQDFNGGRWLIKYYAVDNENNQYKLLQVDTDFVYDEAVDVLPSVHKYKALNEKVETYEEMQDDEPIEENLEDSQN